MAFWLNSYYIVVLAWAIYYLWHSIPRSFDYELPWSTCTNSWNTLKCIDAKHINTSLNDSVSSTEEFWVYNTLQKSSGLAEQGTLRWELAICLFFAWVLCYFCIWKGIKWTGKVS